MKHILRVGRFVTAAAVLSVLGPLAPAAVSAEDAPVAPPSPPAPLQQIPSLGGHAFLVPTRFPDPFVRTTFRSTLGVGATNDYSSSTPTVGDTEVITVGGTVYYTALGFQYQQSIKPWIAMFLVADLQGRLGTGLKAALLEGVRASATGEVGWLVRVMETDRLFLSGSFSVSNNSTTAMDPLGFVNGAIENGGIEETNRLVVETPTMLANVGLRGAWVSSETVGILGFVKVSGGDSYERAAKSATYAAAGVAVDVSLRRWLHAPVSTAWGYCLGSYPVGGDDSGAAIQTAALQVGYLAPGGFSISAEFAAEWLDRHSDFQTLQVMWPTLTMKYYF